MTRVDCQPMRMPSQLVLAAVAVLTAAVHAQQTPAFDVVSIKRSSPEAAGSVGGPPGWFRTVNTDVTPLIGTAYSDDLDTSDYVGLPGWATTERFDVEARMPEGARPGDLPAMVRTLLAERFAFKGHVETRERPIFVLVRVQPNGPLPAGLEKVNVDCEAIRAARGRGEKPELKVLGSGLFPCDLRMQFSGASEVVSGGMRMADFARSIQSGTGRIVLDKTGLEGYYAFRFRYTGRPTPDSDVPALPTALQEQLGLRLESATGPVRVLVVDHIERPTAN